MKALIIYDSVYGNTEKIAKAIGKELACDSIHVSFASSSSIKGLDLLITGTPTHGGMPSPAMQKFSESLPKGSLSGIRVASFDTWITKDSPSFFTRLAVGIFGHAAPRALSKLQALGGKPVAGAEAIGFLVKGKEGPLVEGEMEKAQAWAKKLAKG
ncbi:MAG: flavodoxin family protein [Candidatus Micrarchaeia archaeon]